MFAAGIRLEGVFEDMTGRPETLGQAVKIR
jgi:hypothetical protein